MKEGQAKVLSETEFRRVVNLVKKKAHAKRNIALLYCSFGLGLRAKEMASLKVKHVLGIDGELLEEINLDSSMTKGRKQRHVFLTNSRVIDAFRYYLHDRQKQEGILFNYDAALFLSQKGDAFSPNTLQQLFHRMFREARLQGASSHSGRRSFATALIEKGIDIKAVSTLMGHSSIAMTAKYVQDNPVRLKQICTDLF
ncbi:phage integrase family protein [Collimonas arenae]|uniref:Phage integrase family protein n=1 Tax=Collimonas arenae TaxID=279058 RepID=A0A127PWD1_9BURK|nr:site-specific integrase [Collimonas arenae]AMP02103.1 phage integrase family protein [Collimonas arenae]AMP11999.1 phage integrase family protein [Collimonas arenae]